MQGLHLSWVQTRAIDIITQLDRKQAAIEWVDNLRASIVAAHPDAETMRRVFPEWKHPDPEPEPLNRTEQMVPTTQTEREMLDDLIRQMTTVTADELDKDGGWT